ncbi:MAG: fumarate/nitrate reduction transcriptional regulator Fnr [Idiomarina sp.]|nr:fumarate/nitrate reduction transcriptional regulator Fnr [Idiomarina sp.]
MNDAKRQLNHIRCQNCGINQLCLPYTLDDSSLSQLDSIIERKRPYQRSEQLYQDGTPLSSLFALRSGSMKSYIVDSQGDVQITAFHLPGDLIGFSSISDGIYKGYTEALETSMVCEIPYDLLDTLTGQLPALRKQIMRLMSEEISADKRMLSLVTSRSAEERLATFLLELSGRFRTRGLSPREFRLTMTRAEIGNYLGLTVETVSRLLGKFQREQLVRVEGRLIHLTAINGLSSIAGVPLVPCQP